LENLISGVRNFLPTNKLCTVTRLAEALMDSSAASNQSLQETDEYIMLDPRSPRNAPSAARAPVRRSQFTDGIVFVVGGAGYVEYGNLEEWASKTGRRVTYGGTEIWDPEGFVSVLRDLGKAQS
jgi:sec1 family domain-containing protein 1